MRSYATVAVALSLGSTVAAQASVAKMCPESDVCYSLNIPESTVQSDSQGDIYFQISAPTKYQWVALGQGSRMSGSNIFVMYTSGDGQNVTVSPRLGTGHVEPQHNTGAQIEVLAGSGVADGMMTANVKCSNCNSWSGGTMDFTAQSANWIYAYRTGDALDSDDLSEGISQHQKYAPFQWSLASARGGDSTNPFVAAAVASTDSDSQTASMTSGGSSATPTATTAIASPSASSNGNTGSSSGSGSVDGNTGSSGTTTFSSANAPFGGNFDYGDKLTTAHGTLASLAFVALFPTGAILIRVANFTGLVWLHAGIQALGFLIFIAAFGLGIYIATQLSLLGSYHPIIGIILFVVLISQPVTGLLHHKMFKSLGGRGIFSFVHLGIGRIVILLGLINGGLGLMLADATTGEKTAYAVCAAIVGVVYIASAVFGEVKMNKRKNTSPGGPIHKHRHLESADGQNGISMAHITKERP